MSICSSAGCAMSTDAQRGGVAAAIGEAPPSLSPVIRMTAF
jgi:hypothetical protein